MSKADLDCVFGEMSERAFAFLVDEFGFARVGCKDNVVEYRRPEVSFFVYYADYTFEMMFEFVFHVAIDEPKCRLVTSDLLSAHRVDNAAGRVGGFQASNRERLNLVVPMLADLCRMYIERVLDLDSAFLDELVNFRERTICEYEERETRRRAEIAWAEGRWKDAVAVYGELGEARTKLEDMRYKMAIRRAGEEGACEC